MQKILKPLKTIPDNYDEDMFDLLISQTLNVPEIKNTKEIQRCFQRMAHAYAERTYPKSLGTNTKCRRRLAQKIWQWFVGMYPKIADYFCGVEYKMSGGFGDPRGRYILIPKDEDDSEWSEWGHEHGISLAPHNRHMNTIIKENTKQYNRDMADSGLPHQSVTKYNRDYPQLLQLKQQVQDKKKQGKTTRVCLHRYSSYQGYKEDCYQHMLGTPKYLPPVFSFVENGIIHLAFNYSARKGDFLEYPPILRKLLEITPTELIFENESRIGREYSEDTISLLKEIGFRVFVENKVEKYDITHHHPRRSQIQRKSKALNRAFLIPVEKIENIEESRVEREEREREGIESTKDTLLSLSKRFGNYCIVKSSIAKLAGFGKKAKAIVVNSCNNLLAQIKAIALSNDTNIYQIFSSA